VSPSRDAKPEHNTSGPQLGILSTGTAGLSQHWSSLGDSMRKLHANC